mgnify:CR=1 FL=1
MKKTLMTICALALSLAGGAALAQETVKIGVINAYSGQFADPAAQLDAGIKLYMQIHGDAVLQKNWWCARALIFSPATC